MLRCKASVRFKVLRKEVWSLFPIIEAIFIEHLAGAVITCGTEAHGENDPHTNGYALDIRSKNLSSSTVKHTILSQLRAATGPDYTVLLESEGLENEHFHLQIRKGLWRSLLSDS